MIMGKMPVEGCDKLHDDLDSHFATDNTATPLSEMLVHSSMPAAAVAMKLSDDSAEEIGESIDQKEHGVSNTFQRRAFRRISLKGESGPLLSR